MTRIIKFILVIFAFIFTGIICIFVALFCNKKKTNRVCGIIMHHIFSKMLCIRSVFIDVHKIDEHRSVTYVTNHQSAFDFVLLGANFPRNTYIIGKSSIKYMPLLNIVFKLEGNFFLQRGNSEKARATIDDAMARMREQNCSILIFPQGTRRDYNQNKNLKKGFAHIAKGTQTDIVPILISSYGAKDILCSWVQKKPITVKVCDPISHTQSIEEIRNTLSQVMNQTIAKLDA